MGYSCYCIPLRAYGIAYGGFVTITHCGFLIWLCTSLSHEKDLFPVFLQIFFCLLGIVAAVLLVIGTLQRRHAFIAPYLILMVMGLFVSFMAISVLIFMAPDGAVKLFVGTILSCLFVYPIFFLFLEIMDENDS